MNGNKADTNQKKDKDTKLKDFSAAGRASSSSIPDSNNVFNPRAPFDTGNDPKIPVVSMKTPDQRQPRQSEPFVDLSVGIGTDSNTVQRNNTKSVFNLSQFGIIDGTPEPNTTFTNNAGAFQNVISYNENANAALSSNTQQNTKNEYPFDGTRNQDKEPTTTLYQKGPTIRVISGFKDHASKPVLLSQGAFIDFTALDGTLTGKAENKTDNATTNTNDTSAPPILGSGIALPGVQELGSFDNRLSPVQVNPFKPYVAAPTPTSKPVLSPKDSTTPSPTNPDTNIPSAGSNVIGVQLTNTRNGADSSVNVAAESRNHVAPSFDSNGIPVTSIGNPPLLGSSAVGSIENTGVNTNIGGALVNNHINVDDITNDLFNNRVTGPVPDGIPAGEKLKIDNIYPVVSNTRQNISSSGSPDSSGVGNSANVSGPTNGIDSQTVGVMPATNTAAVNIQGPDINNAVGLSSNSITNQGLPNANQNLQQSGISSKMNSGANTNTFLGGSPNTGLPINRFSGLNNQFMNNNIQWQQMQGNVMQGQNSRGQINPVLPNQQVNRNFATTGGQQVFNNRLPNQRVSANTENSFPTFNSNFQNRISIGPNTIPNTMPGNGQSVQGGMNRNAGPNVFNNFQNVLNPSDGIRTVPGNNLNQFNNNLQRGAVQIPFDQFVNNNGLRRFPATGRTGLDNGAIVNQNRILGVQNIAGNSFMSGTPNNFIQGNEPQNPFTTEQFNRITPVGRNVPQLNTNSNVGNTLLSQNAKNVVINPNIIASNNRIPANQDGTGLNANDVLNNQIILGGVTNTGASWNSNNPNVQPRTGMPNAILPGPNGMPGSANTGFSTVDAGGLDQLQLDLQNSQMTQNWNIRQSVGKNQVQNNQVNQNLLNQNINTQQIIGQNQIMNQMSSNMFNQNTNSQQPTGQNQIQNNQVNRDLLNQNSNTQSMPGQNQINNQIIPNTFNQNSNPQTTIGQNQINNQFNPIMFNQNINTQQTIGQDQIINQVNRNMFKQNINSQQTIGPNQIQNNEVNQNLLNQNINTRQTSGQNQMNNQDNPNMFNNNMTPQQNIGQNQINNQLNPDMLNQNSNPQQTTGQNQNQNNQVNQTLVNRNIDTQQTTGQNQIQNQFEVNPSSLNQNTNSLQNTGQNQINNKLNPNTANKNINTQQIVQQSQIPNNLLNQNMLSQNKNTQQMTRQNMFANGQTIPNLPNQNTNTQQIMGQSQIPNIQNMEGRNMFGANNGFTGQIQPLNVPPGFTQTSGFQNRFQAISGIPVIGQNPTFMQGPRNNFQTPIFNGPPRNIQGQFINRFSNNFGQLSQTPGR